MVAYGVTRHGNFEAPAPAGLGGKNILEFVGDLEQRPALAEARRKLFEAREKRVHPGRDEKVLTSWNGLMLAAFAEAARAFSPSPQPSPRGRGFSEIDRGVREIGGPGPWAKTGRDRTDRHPCGLVSSGCRGYP